MNCGSEIFPRFRLALFVFLELCSPYTPSIVFLVIRCYTSTAGFASPSLFPRFIGWSVIVEKVMYRLWVYPVE